MEKNIPGPPVGNDWGKDTGPKFNEKKSNFFHDPTKLQIFRPYFNKVWIRTCLFCLLF
jgi:hypothetical protein